MNQKMLLETDEQAILALRGLYQQFGYSPYKMSRFEEYELYVENKDFLVSDQVITFSDRNGKLLALKPDVTLSIIKNSTDNPGRVQKVYYNENVYRVDPGTHDFREIMQTGLECVGDLTQIDIAEVVLLAAKSLALLADSYILDVSHMGLVNAFLECFTQQAKLKAMDCLRRKSAHELLELCRQEGCGAEITNKVVSLVDRSGTASDVIGALRKLSLSEGEKEYLHQLEQLYAVLDTQGYGKHIRFDFSVGSDMKYYSGIVFKGYLENVPMGVLSGGRYDKLLHKMGRTGGAVGFAIYVNLLERLYRQTDAFDIDTVLLHDGKEDPAVLLSIARQQRELGSVLLCTSLPENRSWRRLVRAERGEAVLVEDNG